MLLNGVLSFGISSFFDRRMGSFYVFVCFLCVVLYVIIGEKKVIEWLLEWSDEKEEVVWIVKGVDVDFVFMELFNDLLVVVNWLVE